MDIETCKYWIDEWENKPDRKGAVRDLRKALARMELENEIYSPLPIVEPLVVSAIIAAGVLALCWVMP